MPVRPWGGLRETGDGDVGPLLLAGEDLVGQHMEMGQEREGSTHGEEGSLGRENGTQLFTPPPRSEVHSSLASPVHTPMAFTLPRRSHLDVEDERVSDDLRGGTGGALPAAGVQE